MRENDVIESLFFYLTFSYLEIGLSVLLRRYWGKYNGELETLNVSEEIAIGFSLHQLLLGESDCEYLLRVANLLKAF